MLNWDKVCKMQATDRRCRELNRRRKEPKMGERLFKWFARLNGKFYAFYYRFRRTFVSVWK